MATDKEWKDAYDEASRHANESGRFQYIYAGEVLALEGWMDVPMVQRPDELPDAYDVESILDGYISDLDDEAGFSLWYHGGREAMMEKDDKLPHCHTWFYWARFHEDAWEMNEHFANQCKDTDMPLPQWYLDELEDE